MSNLLGNNAAPSNGYIYNDFGSGYQYWVPIGSMPTGGGIVTDVYVYAGGDGVSWTGNLCLWSGNTLMWNGAITFPSNPRANGNQQWLHLTVPNVYLPAGAVNLGWWAGGNTIWTQETTGTTYRSSGNVGGSPTTLGGAVSAGIATGAYLLYTPSLLQVRRGAGWSNQVFQVRRGGVWTTPHAYVRRNNSWVQIQ